MPGGGSGRRTAFDGPGWAGAFRAACGALLAAFSETYSYSLQQTLYAMGEAVLGALPEVCEVRLALPNKHHFLVDLAPFGRENRTRCTTRPTARTG